MAGQGTDPDLVGLDLDIAELVVKVVDVDQVLEVRKAQFHHRQQAVAASHQPGRAPQSLQQADGLFDSWKLARTRTAQGLA